MKRKIKLGIAGLGGRGHGTLDFILQTFPNVEIKAVCDLYTDRVERSVNRCLELRPDSPVDGYTDYREMVARRDLDCVLVTTAWDAHVQVAVAAMNAGKYAGIECGGACSVDECWQLVRTYERTGNPCMFMENCCYGQTELALLNMVQKGIFGEMIHVRGGYQHDLRGEVAHGKENRHYRYDNYKNRCGDFYPQHGLGPMTKYLSINRGNRMLTLTAMASKARGLHEYAVKENSKDVNTVFEEGDVVTTMIKCAHGETMLLTHDTTLPRPYSRGGYVQGTKGLWVEEGNSYYIEGRNPANTNHGWERFSEVIEADDIEHPLWRKFRTGGISGGGHGGMDYLVLAAFFDAVARGVEPPIDTYDAAALLAVSPLSEQSIAMGGMPVAIPDFTDGKWIKRSPSPDTIYALDHIDEKLF